HQLHLWQIFTYPFLHSDPLQLILNLLMLVFIGPELEMTWGTSRFVRFYFFCTIFAGFCYLAFASFMGGLAWAPLIGSDAGIYGLLAAYGILFGERVMLFMMLFPMKAKNFVWILAAVEFLCSLSYGRSGAGSVAALGGMAAGYLFLYGRATWNVFIRKRGQEWATSQRVKRVKGAKHLKLIRPGDKPGGRSGDKDDEPKTWH